MKHKQPQSDVPVKGPAVLVVPKGSPSDLSNVVVMGVMSLADVLRHQPVSYLYRFTSRRKGLVFSEPAPRPLIELIVDLLDATERSVHLEELQHLKPVVRLSPQGIRVYVSKEDERLGLIAPCVPGYGTWDDLPM
jgi:hypothetical protein